MTDQQPDIDIEAERKLFEDTSTGFDLRHWEYDPTQYMERRTEAGLEGWLARARIAAEREREMQQAIDSEKQSRIKYQDLAYATMNAIDSFLGLNVRRGEGTTVDSFKANLQRMLDEIKRIRFDWTNAEYGAAKIGTLLKEAHASVCSLQCPSVWPTNEPQPHSDLCRRITEALKGPSDER